MSEAPLCSHKVLAEILERRDVADREIERMLRKDLSQEDREALYLLKRNLGDVTTLTGLARDQSRFIILNRR